MLTPQGFESARAAARTALRYKADAEAIAVEAQKLMTATRPESPFRKEDLGPAPTEQMGTASALRALDPPRFGTIFINYRRSDVPQVARALAGAVRARLISRRTKSPIVKRAFDGVALGEEELWRALQRMFGDEVFIDVESIAPGVTYEKSIDEAITRSSVFIALVGPGWEEAKDADGRSRLRDPKDLVRVEIESALRKQCLVIPVLASRLTAPKAERLPGRLALLFQRNAERVTDQHDADGISRVLDAIDTELDRREARERLLIDRDLERFRNEPAHTVNEFHEPDVGRYRGDVAPGVLGLGSLQPHGLGEWKRIDGIREEGRYERGRLQMGVRAWPDGDRYEGEFLAGKMHGLGVYTFADGRQVWSQWRDDLRHGFGSSIVDSGYRFDGEFRKDERFTGLLSRNGMIGEVYVEGRAYRLPEGVRFTESLAQQPLVADVDELVYMASQSPHLREALRSLALLRFPVSPDLIDAAISNLCAPGSKEWITFLTAQGLVSVGTAEEDGSSECWVGMAVRQAIAPSMSPQDTKRLAEILAAGIRSRLPAMPSGTRRTLDYQEELLCQELIAGNASSAFSVLMNDMRAYEDLYLRACNFVRGERASGNFMSPDHNLHGAVGPQLSAAQRLLILNLRGLFLQQLGQLVEAKQVFHHQLLRAVDTKEVGRVVLAKQLVAEIELLRGRMVDSAEAIESILPLLAGSTDTSAFERCQTIVGRVNSLLGNVQKAEESFELANVLARLRGAGSPGSMELLYFARHHLLLGRLDEASRIVERVERGATKSFGSRSVLFPHYALLSCELAMAQGDVSAAWDIQQKVDAWACEHSANEGVAWSRLVWGRIARTRMQSCDGIAAVAFAQEARRRFGEGLEVVRAWGYGVLHVDLLVERARLFLQLGDARRAERDACLALYGLARPTDHGDGWEGPTLTEAASADRRAAFRSGETLPWLLAATHPKCRYFWGEVAGRALFGESLLLQAAKLNGSSRIASGDGLDLEPAVRRCIEHGRSQLEVAHTLVAKHSCQTATSIGVVLEDLQSGILTRHPLEAVDCDDKNVSPGLH